MKSGNYLLPIIASVGVLFLYVIIKYPLNEFLLHDDLFFKRNKKDLDENIKYNGFKQYKDEDNMNYFEGLYNHINKSIII